MSPGPVDRYALVSSVDPLDRAWISLGWSPDLEGERASALRDSVPWPGITAGSDDPGWLRGPAGRILAPSNRDRLDYAFLPLDGRLSLSVWGAVGPRTASTREWRVLTHTLLFDRAVFEDLAGNPFVLLGSRAAPAAWLRELTERSSLDEPGRFEPVAVPRDPASLQRFRREHLREVAELGGRLLRSLDDDPGRLEDALARLYESLSRALTDRAGPVALRETDGAATRLLARLAWLSLPLHDRAEVSFTTQQRRTQASTATLVVLPAGEWGALAPEPSISPDRVPAPARGGRRLWARAVARHVAGEAGRAPGEVFAYAALLRRAEVRGWRILLRDDLEATGEQARWSRRWSGSGPSRELAAELLGLEGRREGRAGGARWRAAGHVLALVERKSPDRTPAGDGGAATGADRPDIALAAARALVDRIRALGPDVATPVVRGLVRTLGRGDAASRGVAGLVRCLAASGPAPAAPRSELRRLAVAEAGLVGPLLRDPYGPALLVRAIAEEARSGDGTLAPVLRRALAALADPAEAWSWIRRTLRLRDPGDARAARLVLEAGEGLGDAASAGAGERDEWLLAGIEEAGSGSPSADILRDCLVRPAVALRYIAESDEPSLRRWLTATGVPVPSIVAATARPEAARRLPRLVTMAAELGPAVAARELLTHGLRRLPDGPWPEVVDAVPPAWLRQPATMAVLEPHPAPARHAVRRIATDLGGGTLTPAEAEGLLRLLWTETASDGGTSSIEWIERELPRRRAVPVLAQLFVEPAPVQLTTALRAALLRAVSGARGQVETGVERERLRARSPAVADALDGAPRDDERLAFLTT